MHRFYRYIFLLVLVCLSCNQDEPTRGTTLWTDESLQKQNLELEGLPVLKVTNYRGGFIFNGIFVQDHVDVAVTRHVESFERDRLPSMLNEIKLETTTTIDTLFVAVSTPPAKRDEYYGCSVNFNIPYGMPVIVQHSNTIVIASELDSTVIVRQASDKVLLSRHRGSADIQTLGDISLDVSLPRNGHIYAETDSGNIDLLLPEFTNAKILAESFYLPIELINLDLDTAVHRFYTASGVLGDGTGDIFLKTISGRIRIKKQ